MASLFWLLNFFNVCLQNDTNRKETEIMHVELSLLERLQHVSDVFSFQFGVGKD